MASWFKSLFKRETPVDAPVTQLEMLRDRLDDLPTTIIPEGYALRSYQEGDALAWCEIMEGNVGRNWTEEKFHQKMTSDPRFHAEGLFFATHHDQPVASACAWRMGIEEKIIGSVHMVGALSDHRGLGLGHLVNTAVLLKLKEQGFGKAHLKTDDWRLAAINSYLKARFQPLNTHISHAERWEVILENIAAYEKESGR